MAELIATRQTFGEGLFELMKRNKKVVALTADLGESLRMLSIREKMPERFIDTGVAEANMAGMAAGLALAGYIPVAGTFAVFLTRAYDHIRLQICQNNVHAIMVGSHGGVSNALDGGSAHALEDVAYMRALPNMTIVNPGDANEMRQALPVLIADQGPIYLRLYREPTPQFTPPNKKFAMGSAQVIREGKDVTIVGTGPQTAFAIAAAEKLKTDGIDATIVHVATIQPIDAPTIAAHARRTGRVVTVEDHNINGGLGSAVAEVLGEHFPAPLRRIGVRQFGESGKYADLIHRLGIDADGIYGTTKAFVTERKK